MTQRRSQSSLTVGIRPFVKPGEQLGYAERLAEQGDWPPRPRQSDPDIPTATPFLVVPAFAGDIGIRPLTSNQALHNMSVEIVDTLGQPVEYPLPGNTYTLRCFALNRGTVGSFGGMAEFYIGTAGSFDAAASTPGTTLRLHGLAGFVALPGTRAAITCPKTWTPVSQAEADSTIIAEVYDPFIDRVTQPFDAMHDRHVGRRDAVHEFSGVWQGTYPGLGRWVILEPSGPIFVPFLLQIAVTQSGRNVAASFFVRTGTGGPPTPPVQEASGMTTGRQVHLTNPDFPDPRDYWLLELVDQAMLHFTHHVNYADGTSDDKKGDLIRVETGE
jgi:hypothetical protein